MTAILRIWDVCKRTGISRTRVYKLEGEGRFPARVELGPNSVGWYEHEVSEWCAARRRRRLPVASQNLPEPVRPQG